MDKRDHIQECIEVVDRLRSPGGCPWDIEQTNKSILQCTLEEVYELFEAVDSDDREHGAVLRWGSGNRSPVVGAGAGCVPGR